MSRLLHALNQDHSVGRLKFSECFLHKCVEENHFEVSLIGLMKQFLNLTVL
jgi:invasion protein IalB